MGSREVNVERTANYGKKKQRKTETKRTSLELISSATG